MDETPELQMETDVSSTTGDVSETQQMSGSHGDVEMVIVVEKVKEDEEASSANKLLSSMPNDNNSKSSTKGSPQKDSQPQKTDTSPETENQVTDTENQVTDTENQVTDTENQATDIDKNSQIQKTMPIKDIATTKVSPKSQSQDNANSSSDLNQKVNIKKTNDTLSCEIQVTINNQTLKCYSPRKDLNQKIQIQKKSSKDIQISDISNKTQTQKTVISPTKNVISTSKTVIGPTKNYQIIDIRRKGSTHKIIIPSAKDIIQKKTLKVISPVKEAQINKVSIKKENEKISVSQPVKSVELEKNDVAVDSSSETLNLNEDKSNTESIESGSTQVPQTSLESQSPIQSSEDTQASEEKAETLDNGNKDDKKEEIIFNTSIDICEKSNDSHSNSDISEKDHNKSISRELKSLIKSAKESKIISECTQLTSKTRKSRVNLDSSNVSLNTSVEADKIQGVRRSSNNSQKSNCSEKSEKAPKRSMRSQNPEFVNKVKQFLNSVTGKFQKESDDEEMDEHKKEIRSQSMSPSPKKKKQVEAAQSEMVQGQSKLRSDSYCWRCHWAVEQASNDKGHPPLQCTVCPRTFHYKCLSGNERSKITSEKSWVCPECLAVLHAESSETRSPAMKKISLGHLCELLQYALERMMDLNGVEPFINPVDREAFPDYDKYVVHPMDLTLMKNNIAAGLYGSTEAFLADAQWILHNSIIFNTLQSKLTGGARALVRSCRAEMGEIEACPECYAAAHARRPTWFTDVCTTPHMLLWAKLKGFPYWPAKGMSVNSAGLVDVRFFGAHDRAWVPARDCFLYCEKDPNNFRTKRQDILDSMQEAEQHIRNISRKYGKFLYAPFKTPFDPTKLTEQLKMMIPSFEGELRNPIKDKSNASPNPAKEKRRSNSKSSKGSVNEGDISENEELQTTSRKMADGAEIARDEGEEDFCIEKDKTIEVELSALKEKDISRKRRRSELEEAVITIIETSNSEKRKKVDVETSDTVVDIDLESKPEKQVEEKSNTEDAKKITEAPTDQTDTVSSTTSKTNVKELASLVTEKESTAETTPAKINIRAKSSRTSTPKEKDEKPSTSKHRPMRSDKLTQVEKEKQEAKAQKRRNSRNRSLNNSQVGKVEKATEKKNDKDNTSSKDKSKEASSSKNKDTETNKVLEKPSKSNVTDSPRNAKDKSHIDDDTSLAVIAREVTKSSIPGLPTISNVCSLSTSQNSETNTKATTSTKTNETTVTANCDSSIFTPTSTDNVRNMKEAVNKLQKLRSDAETPIVGRVGVRSFARMTSPPEIQTNKPTRSFARMTSPPEIQTNKPTETVEVEIKSEPIDFDDADRQSEKMDLMNAFHLRPVNPPSTGLRSVRINKVVVAPITRKTASKPPEVRVKAKKTFPQPKKVDDGRSELNSKNSMVYIPIQPPSTQAPIRPTRPVTVNGTANTQTVRPQVPSITSCANSIVNTMTTPLIPGSMSSSLSNTIQTPTVVSNTTNTICMPTVGQVPTLGQITTVGQIPNIGQVPTIGQIPTVGQVATNVHTVPLITSVNGQWTFSLQPVMSVGGIDGTSSPPVVNGLADRNNQAILPSVQTTPILTTPVQPAMNLPTVSVQPSTTTSTTTDTTPGEPPRLHQRPALLNPLDSNTPIGSVPPPSSAGPLTAKLNQNAVKLADFFRTLLEDSIEKVDEPTTQATTLKLQLEHLQWRHQQEVQELKHNHELIITEMRASFEKDKVRTINELRKIAQFELDAAVKAAKSKQWCANCNQEAQFYCCWNTSYCDYPCQRAHWQQHFAVCTHQKNQDNNSNDNSNLERRLQPAPDNAPNNSQAPTLTVGGKVAHPRVFGQDGQQQKTSIIANGYKNVSMVEDQSGIQTMKCVGTYKPTGTQQVSPLLINKQIMNNEENAAKKVVTSGGYLIVGAGTGNQPLVTPSRRTHTIQYYT